MDNNSERTFEVRLEIPLSYSHANTFSAPRTDLIKVKAHYMYVRGGGVDFHDEDGKVKAYFPRVLSAVEVK